MGVPPVVRLVCFRTTVCIPYVRFGRHFSVNNVFYFSADSFGFCTILIPFQYRVIRYQKELSTTTNKSSGNDTNKEMRSFEFCSGSAFCGGTMSMLMLIGKTADFKLYFTISTVELRKCRKAFAQRFINAVFPRKSFPPGRDLRLVRQ